MEVNLKKENAKCEFTFTLTKEEFNERYEKVFKKNAKHFKIPGFRPDKAPIATIEKMYGTEALSYSAIEEYVDEEFRNALEENKLQMVGTPSLNVVKASKEEGAEYTVSFEVVPEANVKKYKELKIDYKAKRVTKKEVDKELEIVREKNARQVSVDDRALENDDISNIDFDGSVDGVPFEGGKGENFDLTIGSGQFIPGFEEQMIGMKIGEERDVKVTFPKEYHSKDLSGKDAVFKVKLNSISKKELPALDDEFAKDVSEFETLEEYKASVKKKVKSRIDAENKAAKESAALAKLLENTEVDVPNAMVEESVNNMISQTEQELSMQGMNLETYCKYLGLDMNVMRENYKVQAEKDVKLRLALDAVAKKEDIKVTDKEINVKIDELAKQYGDDKKDSFKNNENIKNYLTQQLKQEKLVKLIVDSSVVK